MEFTFLGTAAAEGFPAVFCNCDACNEARRLGGKNIRTRSQAIINEDLLIDLPSDTYMHALLNGLRLDRLKFLLITHSHADHFYPQEFQMHGSCFAHNMAQQKLNVFSNKKVYEDFLSFNEGYLPPDIMSTIAWNVVKPYVEYKLGNYTVTPLPANHMQNEDCFIYIISDGKKTILYGNDTGIFFDEVFDYIKQKKIKFDFISLDCTFVGAGGAKSNGHMGIETNVVVVNKLMENGNLNANCQKYITHFSHNGNPLQENLITLSHPHHLTPSHDGLKVII